YASVERETSFSAAARSCGLQENFELGHGAVSDLSISASACQDRREGPPRRPRSGEAHRDRCARPRAAPPPKPHANPGARRGGRDPPPWGFGRESPSETFRPLLPECRRPARRRVGSKVPTDTLPRP